MIFIGNRTNLRIIGSNYRNIWISFIREFNRFSRRRKWSVNDFKMRVASIQEKVNLLRNAIVKREEDYGKIEKYTEVKHNLVSLSTSLGDLDKTIGELVGDAPDVGDVHKKQIHFSLATIILEIKEVKSLNDLAAESTSRAERRSFLKKAGRITAKSVLTLMAAGGSVGLINASLTYLAKDLPLKKRNGLAILISYNTPKWWDAPIKPAAKLLIPTYVARIELAFGQKANVVKKGATKQDLLDILADDSIQNIVVYGHGSWYGWLATDGMVDSTDLSGLHWRLDRKKFKKGLFVRHTCGISKIKNLPEFRFKYQEWVDEINKLNKISEGVKKKLKCSFRAVKRSRGGGREGLYILSEKEVYLPKAAQRDYYSICLFEMIFEGAGWKVGFSVAPETREFWLDNKKVGEKNNFSRDIADYRNKLYAKDQEVGKVFDELIKEIDRFVSSLPLKKEKYDMILFGLPFYKKNQIRGWDRVSYPPEFLINVFGQNEQNEDKLYVMAKKEGN